MAETIGVLVMTYGSPERPEDVEPYYSHILGGRKPRPEMLAELQERYRAISDRPSLADITESLAGKIEADLNARGNGSYKAYVGMKHWHPYIADTVARMAADGIRRAVGMVLTPQYSTVHIASYTETVARANQELAEPIAFTHVESWHGHPLFQAALAERVERALAQFPAEHRKSVPVIFSAHSLPVSVLEKGDPYPRRLQESAEAVAQRLGLSHYTVCYQSAGRTPVPWLGPDVREVMEQLHAEGHRECIICPQGFVADHLEVLYDVDIEYAQLARELGMHMERTPMFNDDEDFAQLLAAVVTEHLAEVQAQ